MSATHFMHTTHGPQRPDAIYTHEHLCHLSRHLYKEQVARWYIEACLAICALPWLMHHRLQSWHDSILSLVKGLSP